MMTEDSNRSLDPGGDGPAFKTDFEMIDYFNRTIPPGISLMDGRCRSGSRLTGELTFCFSLDARFTNAAGFISGGYIAQMLDQAATYAGSFVSGRASPSIDMTVAFIAPAKPGNFTATGRVIRAGRSIAFLEATLVDEAKLVAKATVTAQLLPMCELIQKSAAEPASAGVGGQLWFEGR